MSKFAGTNVHKRLVSEGAYREKRYEEALKSAFLGTDEDWCVRILKGRARGEVLTFVALPRDKWIGANAWGISKYMS